MGRDLLRRKILKRKPPVLLLCAIFGILCAGVSLTAAENEPKEETFSAENPLYPRPLRRGSPANAEFSDTFGRYQLRGRLPPAGKYSESLFLVPEYLNNPLTQQYIRQYSGPGGLSWLNAVMERGGPYLAFIRREIARRKLPPELIYIPVIESGYLATAVSKSGATGLWQFMKNSMGPFNMKTDDWIDERRDFWKSTMGALSKLEENYKFFGDWPLALAAYNAGLGGVNRAIQQGGVRNYWSLSQKKLLKNETIHYVPKLIAVAYILSNPRRFGLEPRWPGDPQWKQVPVDRSADLRVLAKEAGIDGDELIRANRELLYNVTPPGQGYYLKTPGKDAEKIAAVLARKDLPLIQYYFHTIGSGDTLLALALHFGVTVEQIKASNPGIQERYLRIGSRIVIPAFRETGPYRKPAAAGEGLVFNGSHLVKKGETLWSIALAYEVDPEVLAEANGMGLTDILREGRILKTPIK